MSRHLFIISRQTPYLADYMRVQFGEEPDVEVLVDRRLGHERRAAPRQVEVDRLSADRRQRQDVDRQLREAFHAFVTVA